MPVTVRGDQLAYRPTEAAEMLGVKRWTVFELIRSGQLEARKLGGATIILHSELERFVSTLPYAGPRGREVT